MKRCTMCGRNLELDEFPMDRGKRYPKCRSCKALQVSRIDRAYRERTGRWRSHKPAAVQ